MSSELVLAKQQAKVREVAGKIVSGEAASIQEARELCSVPRSTWYDWMRRDDLREFVARAIALQKEATDLEVQARISAAKLDVVDGLIEDATDSDASIRDRDQSRRTLRLFEQDVEGVVKDRPISDGSHAKAWLAGYGRRFTGRGAQAVQVNIQGDLNVGTTESAPEPNEVIEGAVEEDGS